MNMVEFKRELRELLNKHQVSIGVDVEGDTHGISTNFVVLDNDGKTHILNHYSSYLDPHDLK